MLLKISANVNEKDKIYETSLFKAAQRGHADIYTLLLENEVIVNGKCKSGATPLFQAAEKGHADVCTVLLKNNVNKQIDDCIFLLITAVNNVHVGICKILENNPNVTEQENGSDFQVIITARNRHADTCSMILEKNPNVNKKLKVGQQHYLR